ncbi:hypothetical protein OQA88_6296 [Cercophora sp. LCS_1]
MSNDGGPRRPPTDKDYEQLRVTSYDMEHGDDPWILLRSQLENAYIFIHEGLYDPNVKLSLYEDLKDSYLAIEATIPDVEKMLPRPPWPWEPNESGSGWGSDRDPDESDDDPELYYDGGARDDMRNDGNTYIPRTPLPPGIDERQAPNHSLFIHRPALHHRLPYYNKASGFYRVPSQDDEDAMLWWLAEREDLPMPAEKIIMRSVDREKKLRRLVKFNKLGGIYEKLNTYLRAMSSSEVALAKTLKDAHRYMREEREHFEEIWDKLRSTDDNANLGNFNWTIYKDVMLRKLDEVDRLRQKAADYQGELQQMKNLDKIKNSLEGTERGRGGGRGTEPGPRPGPGPGQEEESSSQSALVERLMEEVVDWEERFDSSEAEFHDQLLALRAANGTLNDDLRAAKAEAEFAAEENERLQREIDEMEQELETLRAREASRTKTPDPGSPTSPTKSTKSASEESTISSGPPSSGLDTKMGSELDKAIDAMIKGKKKRKSLKKQHVPFFFEKLMRIREDVVNRLLSKVSQVRVNNAQQAEVWTAYEARKTAHGLDSIRLTAEETQKLEDLVYQKAGSTGPLTIEELSEHIDAAIAERNKPLTDLLKQIDVHHNRQIEMREELEKDAKCIEYAQLLLRRSHNEISKESNEVGKEDQAYHDAKKEAGKAIHDQLLAIFVQQEDDYAKYQRLCDESCRLGDETGALQRKVLGLQRQGRDSVMPDADRAVFDDELREWIRKFNASADAHDKAKDDLEEYDEQWRERKLQRLGEEKKLYEQLRVIEEDFDRENRGKFRGIDARKADIRRQEKLLNMLSVRLKGVVDLIRNQAAGVDVRRQKSEYRAFIEAIKIRKLTEEPLADAWLRLSISSQVDRHRSDMCFCALIQHQFPAFYNRFVAGGCAEQAQARKEAIDSRADSSKGTAPLVTIHQHHGHLFYPGICQLVTGVIWAVLIVFTQPALLVRSARAAFLLVFITPFWVLAVLRYLYQSVWHRLRSKTNHPPPTFPSPWFLRRPRATDIVFFIITTGTILSALAGYAVMRERQVWLASNRFTYDYAREVIWHPRGMKLGAMWWWPWHADWRFVRGWGEYNFEWAYWLWQDYPVWAWMIVVETVHEVFVPVRGYDKSDMHRIAREFMAAVWARLRWVGELGDRWGWVPNI